MNSIVYVIYNQQSAKIYIGQTNNLENRLKRHNNLLPNKSTSYTSRNKGIWKVVYLEVSKNRSEAIKREKQLKSYQGRQFIKKLIKNSNTGV